MSKRAVPCKSEVRTSIVQRREPVLLRLVVLGRRWLHDRQLAIRDCLRRKLGLHSRRVRRRESLTSERMSACKAFPSSVPSSSSGQRTFCILRLAIAAAFLGAIVRAVRFREVSRVFSTFASGGCSRGPEVELVTHLPSSCPWSGASLHCRQTHAGSLAACL